jgi:hypothetical protein
MYRIRVQVLRQVERLAGRMQASELIPKRELLAGQRTDDDAVARTTVQSAADVSHIHTINRAIIYSIPNRAGHVSNFCSYGFARLAAECHSDTGKTCVLAADCDTTTNELAD